MLHSSGKRELIFSIVLYTVFYLLTASVVPYLGVRPDILSFTGTEQINTVKPDIMLSLVICSAVLISSKRSVVLGMIFGFVIDVTCSVPMFSSLTYCLCGHYAPRLSRFFAGRGIVNIVLIAIPLLLLRAVASTFYLLGTWHNISFPDILFGAVLPEYLHNLISVVIVYFVLVLLMRIFRIEKSV